MSYYLRINLNNKLSFRNLWNKYKELMETLRTL